MLQGSLLLWATWELLCSLQSGCPLLRSPPFLPGLGCQRDPSTGGAPVPQGAGNSGPRLATSSTVGRVPFAQGAGHTRTQRRGPPCTLLGFPVGLPTAPALRPCAWAAEGPGLAFTRLQPCLALAAAQPPLRSHMPWFGVHMPWFGVQRWVAHGEGGLRLPQASASLSTGGPLTFRNHVPSSQTQGSRHHAPGWASATAGETATLCLTFVRNWDCQTSSKGMADGASLCGSPGTPTAVSTVIPGAASVNLAAPWLSRDLGPRPSSGPQRPDHCWPCTVARGQALPLDSPQPASPPDQAPSSDLPPGPCGGASSGPHLLPSSSALALLPLPLFPTPPSLKMPRSPHSQPRPPIPPGWGITLGLSHGQFRRVCTAGPGVTPESTAGSRGQDALTS